MEYVIHILILCSIYGILAISLDLIVGHTGLLSLAHAAFYGLGAYAAALSSVHLGASFPVGLASGMVLSAVLSLAVSLPSLRLHDDYFILASFCFQIILFSVLDNWIELTRGPLGISGISQPMLFGWTVRGAGEFLVLSIMLLAAAYLIVHLVASSPFGRVLHAVREDDVAAAAMGKNVLYFKVAAVAVSAALAASAGATYAHYVTYIDPSSFTVMESVLVLAMVILGGPGSRWGALIGAAALAALPEALRFIGLPPIMAAGLRQLIYGAALVMAVVLRPGGVAGVHRP